DCFLSASHYNLTHHRHLTGFPSTTPYIPNTLLSRSRSRSLSLHSLHLSGFHWLPLPQFLFSLSLPPSPALSFSPSLQFSVHLWGSSFCSPGCYLCPSVEFLSCETVGGGVCVCVCVWVWVWVCVCVCVKGL